MPMKPNEREYRMLWTDIQCRSADDNCMIVEGYATTFNTPYTLYSYGGYTVREQVDPKAFEGCDMSDVIMQYDHTGKVHARTRNKTLTLTVDERGLKIRAELSGTEGGRQLYEEIKGGYIDRMSLAFTVDQQERLVTEDKESGAVDVLRTIKRFKKLFDVSAVSMPANDATEISARSFCDGLIAELEAERLSALDAAKRKLALKLKLMEV